jgi:hypothetical protein
MYTAEEKRQRRKTSSGIALFFAMMLVAGGVIFLIIAISPGEDRSPAGRWIVRISSLFIGFVALACSLPFIMRCRFLLTGKRSGRFTIRLSRSGPDDTVE